MCGQLGMAEATVTLVQQTAMLTVSIPLLLALLIRTGDRLTTTKTALPKWPSLSVTTLRRLRRRAVQEMPLNSW